MTKVEIVAVKVQLGHWQGSLTTPWNDTAETCTVFHTIAILGNNKAKCVYGFVL